MPKLVITGNGETREVGLSSGDTLGRTAQNEIPLAIAEASRRHCRFVEEKGTWFVEDLGSSNGTQVNGRRVTKFELQDGDVIQVGKVQLRFLDLEPVAEPAGAWGEDEISLEDAYVLVVGGAGRRGEVIHLPEGKVTVGRHARSVLVLKDASVSGDHAEVVRDDDGVTVRDLGSSNGTFVNGRRIEEHVLRSGDVVRFGAVDCTFGVGDPSTFQPPEPSVSGGGDEAFTRAMERPDGFADETFELAQTQKKPDTLFNLLAVGVVLALGAGVWFLLNWSPQAGKGGPSFGNLSGNLLAENAWSFEVPEDVDPATVPGWEIEFGDVGEFTLVYDPVLSGSTAGKVTRSVPMLEASPTLATLQQPIGVQAGGAYRLVARFAEATTSPVVGVVWLQEERREDGTRLVPIGRDFVLGTGRKSGEFQEVSGVVLAPDGAYQARVGVGLLDAGSATFDEVACVFEQTPPPGRQLEVGGFRSSLDPQGRVRMSRYGNRMIEGIALEMPDAERLVPHHALFQPEGPTESGVVGEISNHGAFRVSQTEQAGRLVLQYNGPAVARAKSLVVPLVGRSEEPVQVTILSDRRGRRHQDPFSGESGEAFIVGAGAHRVRLAVMNGEQEKKVTATFTRPPNGWPTLTVALDGADRLELSFQLDFSAENQEARTLVAEAKDLVRREQFGKAILICDDVVARFPFEEALEREADALRQRLVQDGRRVLEGLERRLDDAVFFRDIAQDGTVPVELDREIQRYAGTDLESGLVALRDRHRTALQEWDRPRRETLATRDLVRAKDHMEDERSRLARLFLKNLLERFPNTEAANQAKTLMGTLSTGSNGGDK